MEKQFSYWAQFLDILPLLESNCCCRYSFGYTHGEVIQAGSVQIERPNSNTTRIYQSSPKAVIEWEGFSVSSDGVVEFYFENQLSCGGK